MFRSRLFALYALKLSESKRYRREWNPETNKALFGKFKNRWLDRKGYRLWFPAVQNAPQAKAQSTTQIAVEKAIDALRVNGATFSVLDYAGNKAVNNKTTQIIAISKLLSKNKPDLLELFNNDKTRAHAKSPENIVIISRHPHDVAGMSTDRGWTSCMNIRTGVNRHYVLNDVQAGTLIAYLVKKDDTNIKKPSARVLIKPFVESEWSAGYDPQNPRILWVREDNQYGTYSPILDSVVDSFLEEVNEGIEGTFCVPDDLYEDSDGQVTVEDGYLDRQPRQPRTPEQIIDTLQGFSTGEELTQAGWRFLQRYRDSDDGADIRNSEERQKELAYELFRGTPTHAVIWAVADELLPDYSYPDLALCAVTAREREGSVVMQNFIGAIEARLKRNDSFRHSIMQMAGFCKSLQLQDNLFPDEVGYEDIVDKNALLLSDFGNMASPEVLNIVTNGLFQIPEADIASCIGSMPHDSGYARVLCQKQSQRFEEKDHLFADFLEGLQEALEPSGAIMGLCKLLHVDVQTTGKITNLAFLLGQYPRSYVTSTKDPIQDHLTEKALATSKDVDAMVEFYQALDDSDWADFDSGDPEYIQTWEWMNNSGLLDTAKEGSLAQTYIEEKILPEVS